ncbi:MAG: IS4 family transposase [Nannocystaceae bacterium]
MFIEDFTRDVVPGDMHEKRVQSLAGGVQGVLHSASLSVSAIGKGYAAVNGSDGKHGIKQVDRLLSNAKLKMDDIFERWVPFVAGAREELNVALDWTEFDRDKQSMLGACLLTKHGRATPLMWKSEKAALLKDGGRTDHESLMLMRLRDVLPAGRKVTIIADRGFGDQALYAMLLEWGWDFAIRFRDCIAVKNAKGESRAAKEWLHASGRARMLKGVQVTKDQTSIPAVVVARAKDMKEPWAIATSRTDLGAAGVVKLYGRRFTIEETFRDLKDHRYGLGLVSHRVGSPRRRDRLTFLFAITHALLTLLGEASERSGYDRTLKANTSKSRTHSLFSQGRFLYDALPNMSDERLRPIMEHFEEVVREHAVFRDLFGVL